MPPRISIDPVARHLDHDTQAVIGGGATIVVGADDIDARHRAQACRPEWLGSVRPRTSSCSPPSTRREGRALVARILSVARTSL
jgi:hypothetical protein